MIELKPKTYNQMICYLKAREVQKMLPEVTDEQAMRIYEHLCSDKRNQVRITQTEATLFAENDKAADSFGISSLGAAPFDQLLVTTAVDRIVRSSSGGSYGGSDGISGNNKNNHNNNNNNNNA
ncbi:MAG: hypothetical protein J6K32_08785 [Clostridia bacterium]|nr:hypothetical protein [Clostridia bacterium]